MTEPAGEVVPTKDIQNMVDDENIQPSSSHVNDLVPVYETMDHDNTEHPVEIDIEYLEVFHDDDIPKSSEDIEVVTQSNIIDSESNFLYGEDDIVTDFEDDIVDLVEVNVHTTESNSNSPYPVANGNDEEEIKIEGIVISCESPLEDTKDCNDLKEMLEKRGIKRKGICLEDESIANSFEGMYTCDTVVAKSRREEHNINEGKTNSTLLDSQVQCVNLHCQSGYGLEVAPVFVLTYFGQPRKKNILQKVCKDCFKMAFRHQQDVIYRLKAHKSVLKAGFPPLKSDVVVMDHVEEEYEEDLLSDEVMTQVREHLPELLLETIQKYDLDFQLNQASKILDKKLKRLEDNTKILDDEINALEEEVMESKLLIYKDFTPNIRALPTLTIMEPGLTPGIGFRGSSDKTTSTGNKSPVAESGGEPEKKIFPMEIIEIPKKKPPRVGRLMYPVLRNGEAVYIMKTDLFSAWGKGKILNYVGESKENISIYRIQMGSSKRGEVTKVLTANYLAYMKPSPVRYPIGTRVVAKLKTVEPLCKPAFYAGLIAEPPKEFNYFRYLVFFDDGFARYVPHEKIHMVCDTSNLAYKDVHQKSREFVKKYLEQYPKRPMAKLVMGQIVRTELNGRWCNARVIQLDCNIAKVHFVVKDKTEWIYRGSTRFGPLYSGLVEEKIKKFMSRRRNNRMLYMRKMKKLVVKRSRDPERSQSSERHENTTSSPGPSSQQNQETSEQAPNKSEQAPNKSERAPNKSEQAPNKSERAPNKSEQAPNGSEQAPNKSEQPPNGSEQAPNKSEQAPNGSEQAPNKSEQAPNGAEEAPNKSEQAPNGSEQAPNKSEQAPNGAEQAPNKSEQAPNGSEQAPNGAEQAPNGSEQAPNGSEQTPNGSEQAPNGSEQAPNGSEQAPNGSEQAPNGSEQAPNGSQQAQGQGVTPPNVLISLLKEIDGMEYFTRGYVRTADFPGRVAGRPFTPHQCGPRCTEWTKYSTADFTGMNPVTLPFYFGFERQIVKYKGKEGIMYVAPCGRRLRTMVEAHRYLRITKTLMGVEFFDFDTAIRILDEFYLNTEMYQIYLRDVSYGLEKNPVSCVNELDHAWPTFMDYSTLRIPQEDVKICFDDRFLVHCDCDDDCQDKTKCDCWKLTIEGAKSGNKKADLSVGYKFRRLFEPVPTGIYECNHKCKCNDNCLNRVAQRPFQLNLQIFKTLKKGWGLRALNDIPQGAFICIYAGRLHTEKGANADGSRHGDEYMAELDYIEVVEKFKDGYEEEATEPEEGLDKLEDEEEPNDNDEDDKDYVPEGLGKLPVTPSTVYTRARRKRFSMKQKSESETADENENEKPPEPPTEDEVTKKSVRLMYDDGRSEVYVMDAKSIGNIGRYLNHSCQPNVFVQNVFVDTHDLRFPWVAFFALNVIRAGSELTWDYNYEVGSVENKVLECYCSKPECRGRLL